MCRGAWNRGGGWGGTRRQSQPFEPTHASPQPQPTELVVNSILVLIALLLVRLLTPLAVRLALKLGVSAIVLVVMMIKLASSLSFALIKLKVRSTRNGPSPDPRADNRT